VRSDAGPLVSREFLPAYISGYADDYEVIREGLTDSGRPFLLKPFSQAELFKKVDEVLKRPGQQAQARN